LQDRLADTSRASLSRAFAALARESTCCRHVHKRLIFFLRLFHITHLLRQRASQACSSAWMLAHTLITLIKYANYAQLSGAHRAARARRLATFFYFIAAPSVFLSPCVPIRTRAHAHAGVPLRTRAHAHCNLFLVPPPPAAAFSVIAALLFSFRCAPAPPSLAACTPCPPLLLHTGANN